MCIAASGDVYGSSTVAASPWLDDFVRRTSSYPCISPDCRVGRHHGILEITMEALGYTVELRSYASCSIQLTNKTDMLVAYYFWGPLRGLLVCPDEDTYVGTILPHSTCTVTVTVKPTTEEALDGTQWINIRAYVVNKDGVKAEDIITKENLLSQSINDEVYETTSEEGKGSESSVRRQPSHEMSSIILFSNYDIKRATNDLSASSKIGHGGYGTVYKGNIHDTKVAIKILDPSSQQGIHEFHQEMEVLCRTRHPNLVKLIGACLNLRALVYEFLPHGSVEDYLKKNPRLLTWQMRTRIVYDICSALTFLHSIKPEPVVHGDLKPANILLDENFISKLADFGLCRFLPGGTATVAFLETKNMKGTEWYTDPDFLETGKLTRDCDVYSFGITMLRILTGAPAARVDRKVERAIREKSLMTMVDSTAGKWPENVAEYLARMGLECCEPERKSTKLMKDILTGLEDILAKI